MWLLLGILSFLEDGAFDLSGNSLLCRRRACFGLIPKIFAAVDCFICLFSNRVTNSNRLNSLLLMAMHFPNGFYITDYQLLVIIERGR